MKAHRFALGLLFCILGCAPAREPAGAWTLQPESEQLAGCALATAATADRRLGLSFHLRFEASSRTSCELSLDGASLEVGGRSFAADRLPPPARISPETTLFIMIHIPIDHSEAWDHGDRSGTLNVRARVDGAPVSLTWHTTSGTE